MNGIPAWRSKLQTSLQKNADLVFSKYMQLATVRKNGTPANRTVVFRGFLNGEDTNDITFVTDKRYNKVEEAAHNPAAEIAWYFTNSREQYRLSGNLVIVGPEHTSQTLQEARGAAWRDMSEKARSQYLWPQPGAPKSSQVDYYQLFDQVRFKYNLVDGTWQEVEINP